MKAILVDQFGDPQVLRLAEVPIPTPRDGQILIRVHAIGVNPVETYIRSGTYAAKPAHARPAARVLPGFHTIPYTLSRNTRPGVSAVSKRKTGRRGAR